MNSIPKVTLFEGHKPDFFVVVIERLVQSCRLIFGPEVCSNGLFFPITFDLSEHLAVGCVRKRPGRAEYSTTSEQQKLDTAQSPG
jgi:hypothetical protein